MVFQATLDLLGEDILPAADDDVLLAPGEIEEAFRVEPAPEGQ